MTGSVSFRQLRKIPALDNIVKEIAERQQRYQAEIGMEDVTLFRQNRVDYDAIAFTDTNTQVFNGDKVDTDSMAYTDNSLADAMSVASGFFATNNYGWVHHDNHKLWLQFPNAGRAVDATENQPSFILNGSPSIVAGIHSNAVDLGSPNTGKFIRAANNSVLDVGSGSFSFWGFFYRASDSGAEEVILHKRNNTPTTGTQAGYAVVIGSSDQLLLHIADGTASSQTATPAASVATGKWYFWGIAVNRSLQTSAVYLWDLRTGALVSASGNISTLSGSLTNTVTLTIGRNALASTRFFSGKKSDYGYANIALSQTEFETIMNRGQLSQPFIPDFMECQVLA